MKRIARVVIVIAAIAFALSTQGEAAKQKAPSRNTLTALPAKQAPALDGVAETLWQKAPALIVRVSGGVNAGRHTLRMKALHDALTSGGYKDNVNKQKTGPALMGKAVSPNWVLTGESLEFADSFKPGDRVGGVLVSPFAGDRGDLKAKAVWRQGRWTLELARPLVTSSRHDVQFADRKASYVFAPAIFDNAEVRHAVASGVYRLVFK